jgi:hypothetical protein
MITIRLLHIDVRATYHNIKGHWAHLFEFNKYECDCEPDSSVSIESGYGLDDGAIDIRSPAEAKGFFLWPLCPGPPSFLYNK